MYIWRRKGKYDISEELAENVVIDLETEGCIIGIELQDVSRSLGKELVTKILNTEKISPTA